LRNAEPIIDVDAQDSAAIELLRRIIPFLGDLRAASLAKFASFFSSQYR
jgi:hypothetical protein